MPNHPFRSFAVSGVLLVVTALSLLPLHVKNAIGTTGSFHHAGHVFAFALLSFVASGSSPTPRQLARRSAACFLTAVTLEALQVILYGGVFEFYDVRNDTIGIVVGLVPAAAFMLRSAKSRIS